MTIGLFVLLLLVGLAAFFSAGETALVSLSKIKIKKLIAEREALAKTLSQWLSHPEYLLTTVLVAGTVVNMAASALATQLAVTLLPPERYQRTWVEPLAWLVISTGLLLFGDIAPKIYARQMPEEISLFVLPPLSRLTRVFAPIVNPFIRFLARFFPVLETAPMARVQAVTLDEIRHAIEEIKEKGGATQESVDIMSKVLTLGDLEVAKIMVPLEKVSMVDWELAESPETQELFLNLAIEAGHTRVPVRQGPHILGYLLAKDLLSTWFPSRVAQPSVPALKALIRPLPDVRGNERVHDLLERFRRGVHMALVTDAESLPIGIVTLEDVLEELVGEILDEYDLDGSKS